MRSKEVIIFYKYYSEDTYHLDREYLFDVEYNNNYPLPEFEICLDEHLSVLLLQRTFDALVKFFQQQTLVIGEQEIS